MKSWRDDDRFQCPDCGTVIALREMLPGERERWSSNSNLLAVCLCCHKEFSEEQWHLKKGIFDPYWDVDF
jgi:DNA-directed RNA polymerase subunit RPC12/RpoP